MSRPWMPMYWADFKADTDHLGANETGAYLMLIGHYWTTGSLPDDDKKLARIARMTPDEWEEARDTIASFFQPGWRHKRIDKELADAQSSYDRRAAAGRRGGNAKAEAFSNARAMPEQCQSNDEALLKQSQPQPHTPSLRSGETRAGRALAAEAKDAAQAFERFWEAWPNKTGKPVAARSFVKVWREADAIIAGVERYIANKPPDRPWLNPATFLNQRRWEDDPAPVAKARGSPAREETSGVAKLLAEAYGIDRRNGTEAAGHLADIRPISITHERVGIADHGDDGRLSGRLPRPDG